MGKLVFGMMQSLDGYIAGAGAARNCRRPAMSSIAISTTRSVRISPVIGRHFVSSALNPSVRTR
ncbi:hypothetical protein BH09GEM1_BH09GEM1_34550 [soil metagenome]